MSDHPAYDVIIIGSGPGGYVAAIRCAQLGLTTAIVERDQIGGRCLNYACIPAKAVLRAADVLSEVQEAGEFGIQARLDGVDFARVHERQREVIATLSGGVGMLLQKHKVDVLQGTARLDGGHVVVDDGAGAGAYQAARGVILACGSARFELPGMPFGERIIGTEEAWQMSTLPKSLLILGAGASGAEIASAYARLGSQVTLVEAADRPLPGEDRDISKVVARGLKAQKVDLRLGVQATDVKATKASVSAQVGDDRVRADYLVVAVGRRPDTAALGLDASGIQTDERGLLVVDAQLQTSLAGVYAIGDLVAGPALAHKASEEGILVAEHLAGRPTKPLEHTMIPRATFCSPPVASFGLSEEQAREQGLDVRVGKVPYGAVGAGTVLGDRSGLVKLVGDSKWGEIVGGHIVGAKATELIQEVLNVQQLEGGYPELARIVHGHPTLSEAISEAARAADGWLIHG